MSYMLFITEDLYIGVSWHQNKFRTTLSDFSQLLPTMYSDSNRSVQLSQIHWPNGGLVPYIPALGSRGFFRRSIQVQAEETCPEETLWAIDLTQKFALGARGCHLYPKPSLQCLFFEDCCKSPAKMGHNGSSAIQKDILVGKKICENGYGLILAFKPSLKECFEMIALPYYLPHLPVSFVFRTMGSTVICSYLIYWQGNWEPKIPNI